MKTFATIAATLLVLSITTAQAAPAKRMLIFKDAMGRILTQPGYVEEATDDFPFNQAEVLREVKAEKAARTFDITNMSKPETAVNDIPAELSSIISY